MILPDHQIRDLCTPSTLPKRITGLDPDAPLIESYNPPLIEPYNPDQVEPASYDVQLGNDFLVLERDQTIAVDLDNPADITKKVHVPDGDFFLLHPGEFVLGTTKEVVRMPDNLVARIEGKSSIGRLGLMVHVTAGYIDPGFHGAITLEMTCLHPLAIKLRPGKRIGQISFHRMSAPAAKPYQGRYQGDTTVQSSRYGLVQSQIAKEQEPREVVRDQWGRPLKYDGSIRIEDLVPGSVRVSPYDRNTYVVAVADNDSPDGVFVTDIFGDHQGHVAIPEWYRWKIVEGDN